MQHTQLLTFAFFAIVQKKMGAEASARAGLSERQSRSVALPHLCSQLIDIYRKSLSELSSRQAFLPPSRPSFLQAYAWVTLGLIPRLDPRRPLCTGLAVSPAFAHTGFSRRFYAVSSQSPKPAGTVSHPQTHQKSYLPGRE
jgi:hypothetical protein